MKHLKSLPRILLLLLDVVVFGFFLYPVTYGLLDLSNAAVMLACLLVAVALLFPRQTARCFCGLREKRWGRALLRTLGIAMAALVLLFAVLIGKVLSRMDEKPDRPCKTVLVLGCMVNGEQASLQLIYRIEAAADYLRANPDAAAILTGGQGRGEGISEAECMYRALTARGIAPERLYREDQSSSTIENLRFSRALMEEQGLVGPVLLISSDFHLYRALRMASDFGLPASGLAARSERLSLPFSVVREAFALIKYGVFDAGG